MRHVTPVILLRSLDIERGGVTKASIKKANTLARKYGRVVIATFVFQPYYHKIIREMYARRLLSKKVEVVNFFADLRPGKVKPPKTKTHLAVKEKGLTALKTGRKRELSYRYYENGLYIKYKRFTQGGLLKFIDYIDEHGEPTLRDEFDEQGTLIRRRHMTEEDHTPWLDRYFDPSGQCYLRVERNPDTGEETHTIHFHNTAEEYSHLPALKQKWLNQVLSGIKYPVAMCELRGLQRFLRDAQHPHMKKIEVIHNSHLKKPYSNIEKIKPSYQELFSHADELDHIVFLTEEQKEDVEAVYGPKAHFRVIPHACQPAVKRTRAKRLGYHYNPKAAVTLARLHRDKQLDEAIKAFKLVVQQIPDAIYFIYGNGKEKPHLQKLINDLNLKQNVFLKPYTHHPEAVYQSAACSILTSRQEAFAMVLAESMAAGTPAVAYDTKYGPSDIINDGYNGYLAEKGNREQLADRIITIMQNPDLREELSRNALGVSDTFSEAKYRKRWINLMK